MARLIFPEAFEQQRELLKTVRAKHTADAGASVLIPYLTEKGINLDADFNNSADAETHHNLSKKHSRDAENHVQQRELKFNPVFSHTRSEVQFLKTFYKPNVQVLGDWGIPVDNNKRINYPPDFESRVLIVRAIKTKHDSYAGATSPLTPFLSQQGINLNTDADATTLAEQKQALQIQERKDQEDETQQRDLIFNPIVDHLQGIGDFLMKLFVGKEKRLGDWGLVVDDSPLRPRLRKVKIKPTEQKTVKGIIIGGTLTNIGTVAIEVYKGLKAAGEKITVSANDKLGMIKGFSSITVVNPGTLETAVFTVLSVA